MQYSQTGLGRVFVLRLEDGEIVHETIEKFALEHEISAAALTILGAAAEGSKLVVGPEQGDQRPVQKIFHELSNVNEVAGVGTLFPDETGLPVLHMHMACGRNDITATGCVRSGVRVWQLMEVVLIELVESKAKRLLDPSLGFKVLNV